MVKSNASLVEELVKENAISTSSIIEAFRQVDRKLFLPEKYETASHNDECYANRPLKDGVMHQSQPLIYGRVMERLMPLTPGMSFLHVGSGTGYFSTLVSYFLGENGKNHGIELHKENVDLALKGRQRFFEKTDKFAQVNYICGNGFDLDVERNIKYDRVYISQLISLEDVQFFMKVVKPSGFLIAPVEDKLYCVSFNGGSIEKGTKIDKFPFDVRFAALQRSASSSKGSTKFVLEEAEEENKRKEFAKSAYLKKSPVQVVNAPSSPTQQGGSFGFFSPVISAAAASSASSESSAKTTTATTPTKSAATSSSATASEAVNLKDIHVMISLNVSSMGHVAAKLKQYLEENGVSPVWICTDSMNGGDHFRREINFVAATCKIFLPIVNTNWLNSAECDSEANIAISFSNRSKSNFKGQEGFTPVLIPFVEKSLWNFDPKTHSCAASGPMIHFLSNCQATFFDPNVIEAKFPELLNFVVIKLKALGVDVVPPKLAAANRDSHSTGSDSGSGSNKKLQDMDVDEVIGQLKSLNLDKYIPNFREQEMNGKKLFTLRKRTDIIDHLIPSIDKINRAAFDEFIKEQFEM